MDERSSPDAAVVAEEQIAEEQMASPPPPARWSRRRRGAVVLAAVIVVSAGSWLVLGRRHTPFDRARAVTQAMGAGHGGLTRAQAGCYVDAVRRHLGADALTRSAPSAATRSRLAALRDDCVGLAGLAVPEPDTSEPVTEAGAQPLHHGQDAALDRLWASCSAGWGQACDDLFRQSPVGSQYEAFALSCGGRTAERQCAAVYASPGVTLEPPAAAAAAPRG